MTNVHGGLSYTPTTPFDATWKCICKNGITGVKCDEEKIEHFCRHSLCHIDVGDRSLKNVTSIKSSVSFTSRYNCRPNDLINHRRALVIKELINAIQRGQQGSIFKRISMENK